MGPSQDTMLYAFALYRSTQTIQPLKLGFFALLPTRMQTDHNPKTYFG